MQLSTRTTTPKLQASVEELQQQTNRLSAVQQVQIEDNSLLLSVSSPSSSSSPQATMSLKTVKRPVLKRPFDGWERGLINEKTKKGIRAMAVNFLRSEHRWGLEQNQKNQGLIPS